MDRVGCNGIRWERDRRGIGSMGLSVGEERGRGEEEERKRDVIGNTGRMRMLKYYCG